MSKHLVSNGNLTSQGMIVASQNNTVNMIKSNASVPISSVTVPISISPSTNNAPLQIQPKPVVTIFQQQHQSSYNNVSNSRLLPAPTPQTQNTFAIQPNNHFISQQNAPITFTLAPIAAKPPSESSTIPSSTTTTSSNTTNFTPIQMRPAISSVNSSAPIPKLATQPAAAQQQVSSLPPPASSSTTQLQSQPPGPPINTPIGSGGLAIASSNGFYREWILEAIDKLRERKARPDADRISTLMKRYHNIPLEDTVACLSKLADSGAVVCVDYKGNISYRNPYKWRKNSANGGGIINPPSITSRLLEAFKCLDRTRQVEGSIPVQPGANHKVGYSINEIEQALQRTATPNAGASAVPDLSKLQLRHCLEREATYGKLIRRPDNTYVIDETGEKKARKTTAIQAKKTSITSNNTIPGAHLSTINKPILNKTIAAAPIVQQNQHLLNNLQPTILQQQSTMMGPTMFTTAYTTQQLVPTILTTQPAAASPSPILPKQPPTSQNPNTPNIAFVKYEPQASTSHQHAPQFITTNQNLNQQHQPLSLVTTQSLVTMPTINNISTQPPTPANEIKQPPLSIPSPQTVVTTPNALYNTPNINNNNNNSNITTTPNNNSSNNNNHNNSTKSNRRGRPPGSKNKRIDTLENHNSTTNVPTFTPNNINNLPNTMLSYDNNTIPAKVPKLEQIVLKPNPLVTTADTGVCTESSIISVTNSDQTVPAIGSVIDLCSECKLPQSEFEKFLFCRDCPIKVHPSCLHYWPELTERARQAPWQCSSCKTCSICNDKSSKESVYICDGCDKGYHSNCHSPKIQEPISRNSAWICCNCYIEGFRIRTDESVQKVFANNATYMNNNNEDVNTEAPINNGNEEVKIKKENCVDEFSDKVFTMNKENNENPPSALNRTSINDSPAATTQPSKQPRPVDVTKWTVEHVCNWLDAEGFSSQSASFREQEIDGACLLLMKRIDVLTELNIKLGPAVKIYEKIKRIQTENSFFKVEEF